MAFHEGKHKDCCAAATYAPSMVEDRCRIMEEIGQRKRQRSPSSEDKKRDVPLYAAKLKVRRVRRHQSNPFAVHTAGGVADASTNTEPLPELGAGDLRTLVRGPLHLVTSSAVRELMKIEDPTLDGEAEPSDLRGDDQGRPSDIRDRSKDCEHDEASGSEPEASSQASVDQPESLEPNAASEGEDPET